MRPCRSPGKVPARIRCRRCAPASLFGTEPAVRLLIARISPGSACRMAVRSPDGCTQPSSRPNREQRRAAAVPGARLLLLHRAELVVAVARCGRSRSGAVKAQPETLTANAESARWSSNLYCAVRSATRVVPHHAFHERDRGPGCRPVGIIDKAVDSNVRARSNIECGPIDELEICASLFVGVHQIVLCDRCANGGGRSVSEYARLNRSSPTDSLRRGRPTHGEADCEGNPKCPFLSEP
jgi:hypothetical protein